MPVSKEQPDMKNNGLHHPWIVSVLPGLHEYIVGEPFHLKFAGSTHSSHVSAGPLKSRHYVGLRQRIREVRKELSVCAHIVIGSRRNRSKEIGGSQMVRP